MADLPSLSSQTFEEQDQNLNVAKQPQPAADNQLSAPTSGTIISSPQPPPSSGASKRRRGRPRGSKNKPKTNLCVARPVEPAMESVQLHIPAGCNILDIVQNYARKHRVSVQIVNGSGMVSDITLSHPPVTLNREFDLVTMSGTYVDSSPYTNYVNGGTSSFLPGGRPRWLTILVKGDGGRLYGGVVDNKVLAAINVVLNVLTFKTGGFLRLNRP